MRASGLVYNLENNGKIIFAYFRSIVFFLHICQFS